MSCEGIGVTKRTLGSVKQLTDNFLSGEIDG